MLKCKLKCDAVHSETFEPQTPLSPLQQIRQDKHYQIVALLLW